MIYIARLKIIFILTWKCNLKERRKVAQRIRDVFKGKYNATVKLNYSKISNQFECYIVMLGETRSYLYQQVDSMEEILDVISEVRYDIELDVEQW